MQVNTAIIGGGPVGLYTAFRLGINGITNVVLESLDSIGGQCFNLYKEKAIYDLPGIVSISAGDLIEKLREQVLSTQKTEIKPRINVSDIIPGDDGFTVKTSCGDILSRHIVIATGGGAFEPRKLPLKGMEDIPEGRVLYSIKSKKSFVGKDVIILGGGDAALDWAMELSQISSSVKVIHRSPSFRAAPVLIEKVCNNDKISCMLNANVKDILMSVSKVTLDLLASGESEKVSADYVVVCFGMVSAANSFVNWSVGLNIKNGKIAVDPITSLSNIGKIFAAGDISYYEGKKNNLVSGFFQGLQISNFIKATQG